MRKIDASLFYELLGASVESNLWSVVKLQGYQLLKYLTNISSGILHAHGCSYLIHKYTSQTDM